MLTKLQKKYKFSTKPINSKKITETPEWDHVWCSTQQPIIIFWTDFITNFLGARFPKRRLKKNNYY